MNQNQVSLHSLKQVYNRNSNQDNSMFIKPQFINQPNFFSTSTNPISIQGEQQQQQLQQPIPQESSQKPLEQQNLQEDLKNSNIQIQSGLQQNFKTDTQKRKKRTTNSIFQLFAQSGESQLNKDQLKSIKEPIPQNVFDVKYKVLDDFYLNELRYHILKQKCLRELIKVVPDRLKKIQELNYSKEKWRKIGKIAFTEAASVGKMRENILIERLQLIEKRDIAIRECVQCAKALQDMSKFNEMWTTKRKIDLITQAYIDFKQKVNQLKELKQNSSVSQTNQNLKKFGSNMKDEMKAVERDLSEMKKEPKKSKETPVQTLNK